LEREGSRVLALGEDGLPIVERAHLAEDAVADHAAHLRGKTRFDAVEPTGDQLRGLLRARERTREHERVFRRALRQGFAHRAPRQRERALVVLRIGALCMATNLEQGHRFEIRRSVGLRNPWSYSKDLNEMIVDSTTRKLPRSTITGSKCVGGGLRVRVR